MKTKFLPLLTLIVCLLAFTTVFAQPGKPKTTRGHQKRNAEMKAYEQKHIYPVMLQQRLKLEKHLSPADKKQIGELRKRLAANRQQTETLRKNRRQQGAADLTEAQQMQLRQYQIERRNIRTEAVALAYKYDATIQALFKEVAGPAATWRKDLQAIAQQYANDQTSPLNPDVTLTGKKYKHRLKAEYGRGLVGYLRPVPFLLWDGHLSSVAEDAVFTGENRIYPNPVTTSATLAYGVASAGKVIIDLLDGQGNLIRNLRNSQQEPGNYRIDLSLSDLKTGIYFLKVSTTAGTETTRFLKN